MRREIKIYPYHWIRLIMIALLGFLLLSLFSCKVREKTVTQYEFIDSGFFVEKFTTRFDTIIIPQDSAYIKAWFQCDSSGNALIRQLEEEKGKFKIRTVYRNNTIEVRVNVDSSEIIRRAEKNWVTKYNSSTSTNQTADIKKKTFDWKYIFIAGLLCGIIIPFLIKRGLQYLKKLIL